MQRIPPELTSNARTLRNGATDAERKLWDALKGYRPRFTRQLVVGHFIVDIACRPAKLAVELDGGHHGDRVSEDTARSAYLEASGWLVLRFWNSDVMANVEGVAEVILAAVGSRMSTHPRPLPSREGRQRSIS